MPDLSSAAARAVEGLLEHPSLGPMVAHHRRIEGAEAVWGTPREPLHPRLAEGLALRGIPRLWSHQAEGIDRLREGRNLLVATPTASGKTLLFAVAVLESVLADADSRALFLYPTKALARDQLNGFRSLSGSLGALRPPTFEIYDGDTPAGQRKKIRKDPPHALITNPDMLHAGILSNHADWEPLLANLKWIVIDELHVYRGIFGAHVHHILGRLKRLCARYGSQPRFIAASATVGNPSEFAHTLTGEEFALVEHSGAPRSPRDVVFLNPVAVSPYTAAVRVVGETVRAGLRTIAFTKARRTTELLYTWIVQQEPALRNKVAPYRAGYLPAERRRLEQRLASGDLAAVLSTSALELGIDIGGLDACVLVGYPGSLISSWQRIGRVGRARRDGVVVMVAMPDALDQYVVQHPEMFFDGSFENAVLDPWNPLIAGRHMICAASEEPLERAEVAADERSAKIADDLAIQGKLSEDASGERFYSFRRRPQRDVNPRSAAEPFTIVDRRSNKMLGSIDGQRVYHECHEGAVYLHGGQSFVIAELDREKRRVIAQPARVDYYTVVQGDKETAILERTDRRRVEAFPVGLGRLEVTVRIRGYQKKRLNDGETISSHPLDIPPLKFETVGFWVELPAALSAAYNREGLHFMGGIHATEHATIGLFPLSAIADRGDIGGISYTGHPQLGCPAIFVYDAFPGGAGLADRGFDDLEMLLERTRDLVDACDCEDGCPSCIQSPKCGNGNKPLDKTAASLTLALLTGKRSLAEFDIEAPEDREPVPLPCLPAEPAPALEETRRHGVTRAGNLEPEVAAEFYERARESIPEVPAEAPRRAPTGRVLIFDLETQRSAAEVGGWDRADRMGLALGVVYDVERRCYRTYYEADVDRLLVDLLTADRVVGFNIDRFDLPVLGGLSDADLTRIATLDMLTEVKRVLGYRLSLAHLCEVNLGESKSGDGMQSLVWWKQGRIDLIEQYCRKDVELTWRLFERGLEQGHLLYRDKENRMLKLPVAW
jgi:DEAD/DEAH box helicase domain-containing protein